MSSHGMLTQVFYHEWTARYGRVRCTDAGLEIRFDRYDMNMWLAGFWGTKVIPYESIVAGYRTGDMVRLQFDGDDEIILHRRVLDGDATGRLSFPYVQEASGLRGFRDAVQQMRRRQRALPPVSWELGRHGGRVRSTTASRAIQSGIGVAIIGFLTWRLLGR
jgi:hypothetical protein